MMRNKVLIFVLIFTSTLKLWSKEIIAIKGEGFNSYAEVALKVYSSDILGYESIGKHTLDEKGNFCFQTPFIGENLYELNFDEKDFVHLSVSEGGQINVYRKGAITYIEGSPYSQKILEFQQQNNELQARHFGKLKDDMDKAMKEEDHARIDDLQKDAEIAIGEFLSEFRSLIVSMGTTPAGFYALQYSDFNKELEFIESRLAAFEEEVPGSTMTKALKKLVYQAKSLSIGVTPPNFTTHDIEGKEVSLSHFKGKVLLIDFWAYWCRACRVENPKYAKLYEVYKDKGFRILSITQEVKEDQWTNAIKKDGIEAFQHVFDKGDEISHLYSISSLPQNLLLDQSGEIIAKNINAEELETILKKKW